MPFPNILTATGRTRTIPRPWDSFRSRAHWSWISRSSPNRAGCHCPHRPWSAEILIPEYCPLGWLDIVQELPWSIDARDQAFGRGRHEDSDLCTGRTEVHYMDWRWYPGWIEYFQKGRIPSGSSAFFFLLLTMREKMWVSADEWHEDPEIIQRKFVWSLHSMPLEQSAVKTDLQKTQIRRAIQDKTTQRRHFS